MKSDSSTTVSFRIDEIHKKRIRKLKRFVSKKIAYQARQSDVLRSALVIGLSVLEDQLKTAKVREEDGKMV